jgi:uncharacterized protein (DUF924 family)
MPLKMPQLWKPVLEFWFGDGLELGWPSRSRSQLWFGSSEAVDAEIADRFGPMVDAALMNEWVDWLEKPLSRLALVILLDQFTRNIYRGSAKAFSGDHRAVTLVLEGISRGMDKQLPFIGRVFFYMPLMHAEELSIQDECMRAYSDLQKDVPDELKEAVQNNLDFARQHHDIIKRFGRFPHRNECLQRESSQEEIEFLQTASRFGQ